MSQIHDASDGRAGCGASFQGPVSDLPESRRENFREVASFYLVCLALTAILTAMLWHLPDDFRFGDVQAVREAVGSATEYAVALPAACALVFTVIFRGWRMLLPLARRVMTLRVSPLCYAVALLSPVAAQLLALLVWSRFTGTSLIWPAGAELLSYWGQLSLIGAVVLLGEEIGWRGFMLPRLLRSFDWRRAALISGTLWAGWHMPFWLPANYAATGSASQTALALVMGSVGAIALSVIITWLFIRTRYSVAIAALLHGSNNAGMSKVYDMLGDGVAANGTWIAGYNLSLAAVAALFFCLPLPSAERSAGR